MEMRELKQAVESVRLPDDARARLAEGCRNREQARRSVPAGTRILLVAACLAAIPREKDTAKYPRAMGKPSRIPSQNIFLLNLSFIVVKPHLSVRRLLAHMSYYNAHSDRRKGAKLTYITAFSA